MEEKFWAPEGEVHGAVAVLLLGSVRQGAQEQHHHKLDSLFWSLWLGVLELSCAGGSPTFIFKKTVISIHCEISHSCCD